MKNGRKKWLVTACLLIAGGFLLFTAAFAAAGLDITKLDTQTYKQKEYHLPASFDSICAEVDTARISFLAYEGTGCRVTSYEAKTSTNCVRVEDGCLKIQVQDHRKWYDHIGVSFASPSNTVSLPKSSYASLTVRTKVGSIEVPDGLSFQNIALSGTTAHIRCLASASESVNIRTTTGSITLGQQDTKSIALASTTGGIQLTDVIAKGRIHVENTTGGLQFLRCDAPEIDVKTSTGNVTGSLLSGKNFSTSTATGKVTVSTPQASGEILDSSGNAAEGNCQITTTTGDIRIEVLS